MLDNKGNNDVPQKIDVNSYIDSVLYDPSIDSILNKLNDILKQHLQAIETNAYYIDLSFQLISYSDTSASPKLDDLLNYFIESGIIDWVISGRDTRIIDDPLDSTGSVKILIKPVFSADSSVSVIISIISNKYSEIDQNLQKILNITILLLENFRKSNLINELNDKITSLSKKVVDQSKVASRGEIVSNISRELESHVKIVEVNLNLLESGVGNSSRRIEIIRGQMNKAFQVIEKLSDLTNLNDLPSEKIELNITKLIDEINSITYQQFKREAIDVSIEYEKQDITILAIKHQIEYVIMNILQLSKSTMPEGGRINIGVYVNNSGKAVINISDTGNGISEKNLDNIYQPNFSLVEGLPDSNLFLVKTIVNQQLGKISVFSEFGKGTTFRIVLPLANS